MPQHDKAGAKTSVKALATAERQRRAVEARLAGFSLEAIADQLGYASASGAQSAIASALRRTLKEPADALRMIEVRRYDKMLSAIWERVIAGDLSAIDRAIKISARRCELLGLDAPVEINVNRMVSSIAEEFGLSTDERAEVARDVQKYLDDVRAQAGHGG